MLPDTLGILNPGNTYEFCKQMIERYPDLHFDFHAHNDYDLAVANVYSAVRAGVHGVHTTINGLGERAGNAPLSSVIAVIKDHLGEETSVREERSMRQAAWSKPTRVFISRRTAPSSVSMSLRNVPVCMPTATAKIICIATT